MRYLHFIFGIIYLAYGFEVSAQATNANDREQAVRMREDALSHRETVITTQENDLKRRIRTIEKREEAVGARELVVSRREKALTFWEDTPKEELPSTTKPRIVGKYALVMDAKTGAILYEKSSSKKTAVASTQKLLTALLVLENGSLDKEITITKSDVYVTPTIIGVKPGQKYTRQELVEALLIRSGNDIARALARDHSGSVEEFARSMTNRALTLGMSQSQFKNPHGLTQNGQYSTAHDMGILARECLKHNFIKQCISTKTKPFYFNDGSKRTLKNTNKLLTRFDGCTGMKTGYTRASGNCLVSCAYRGEKEVISVVLGSNGSSIWNDSSALLNWGLGG